MAGLVLEEIAVDGCITSAVASAPAAARWTGRAAPEALQHDRRVRIPLDRVLAAANRHDSPLLAGGLDKLDELGLLPDQIRVHLDAGYDSQATREELAARNMTGQIVSRATSAAAGRAALARGTHDAWHNAFNRLQRCYEQREIVIEPSSAWPIR